MIVDFSLEVGLCNGSMTVDIYNGSNLIKHLEDLTDAVDQTVNVAIPSQLTFVLTNKNANDTIVSGDEIVADKYIKLSKITVGKIPVNSKVMFDICRCTKEGHTESWHDTYWGFNGMVTIDFLEDSLVKWHLNNNNIFNFVSS
jgi:hypothetical protein